jgi:cytoskeletal protein CcmA (bactofilin family)
VSGQTPQSAGKIALTCPYCGFKQLESPYAKSTFCRKCGEHYEPGKTKPILRNERPSFLARVSKIIVRNKTREITCFDCGAVQTVSSSSSSSLCPHCSAYIDLSDFKINAAYSRLIQTQGTVVIGSKADVTSSKVACREALVKGRLRGNLFCTGGALFKYKGKVSGSVEARHIEIAKRSEVEFVRAVKAKTMEISGKISGNLQIAGTVTITKHGWVEGTVRAKGIVIEKGGVFLGELVIGARDLVQPELTASKPQPGAPASPSGPRKGGAQPPKAGPGGEPPKRELGQQNLDLDL